MSEKTSTPQIIRKHGKPKSRKVASEDVTNMISKVSQSVTDLVRGQTARSFEPNAKTDEHFAFALMVYNLMKDMAPGSACDMCRIKIQQVIMEFKYPTQSAQQAVPPLVMPSSLNYVNHAPFFARPVMYNSAGERNPFMLNTRSVQPPYTIHRQQAPYQNPFVQMMPPQTSTPLLPINDLNESVSAGFDAS